MKYHLGCGSQYFEGYTNVDYPQDDHNVNHDIKADVYTNILLMKLEPCDEIRSHHFFEHFNFYDTFVLLYNWTNALKVGGTLTIDVPDLEALCQAYLVASSTNKFLVKRYLFGSHEAHWAFHINGWCKDTLSEVLGKLGFSITNTIKYGDVNSVQPNCGITIYANKDKELPKIEVENVLIEFLKLYKNGNTDFENSLYNYFVKSFKEKIVI